METTVYWNFYENDLQKSSNSLVTALCKRVWGLTLCDRVNPPRNSVQEVWHHKRQCATPERSASLF